MWHPALRPGLLVLFGPVGGNLVLVLVGLSFGFVILFVFWFSGNWISPTMWLFGLLYITISRFAMGTAI